VTSVVRRVTRDAVENLSIFLNVKDCIFEKISLLRFFAKPADAFAQVKPAIPPHVSDATAMPTSIKPVFRISVMSAPSLIWLMSCAVINGINVSISASPTMKISVRIDDALYSRTHFASFFIIRQKTPFPQFLSKIRPHRRTFFVFPSAGILYAARSKRRSADITILK